MPRNEITQERLIELLDYCPMTGLFSWRVNQGPAKVGDIAGSRNEDGYIKIGLDGRIYAAHRLACLYVTGHWPAHEMDHWDNDPSNNQWKNLREATPVQNSHNKRKYKNNTTGYKGVYTAPNGRQWHARIRNNGKLKLFGVFDTPELAHEFYCLAADMLHGNFANYG